MSKRWDRTRFKAISRLIGDRHQRVWQAFCWECAKGAELVDSTQAGMPPEMVAKKFTVMGWSVGHNASRDRCPDCSNKPKTNVVPMKAEPPRQPTREDRRRIIDALEEHYDTAHERYTANWSDKALAAKLSLPLAWVAEERDRAYGPDVNEAAEKRSLAVVALEKRLSELEEQSLRGLDEMRAAINALKTDLSYMAA